MLAKPVIKGIILVVVFLMMIFSSIPSMFFEEPVDTADNTGPQAVYQPFKDYALQAYQEDIEKDFQQRIAGGEFSAYDHVTYTYSFLPSEETFLAEVQEACVLIIAMFEIQTDDWRKASFDHFKAAVDSVNFWNDTVEVEKKSEETEVTWEDGGSTIHVSMTYNIYDRGVEQFRKKFGLQDEKEYLKSVEMAYNTKVFFGESADLPLGGITGGGGGRLPRGRAAVHITRSARLWRSWKNRLGHGGDRLFPRLWGADDAIFPATGLPQPGCGDEISDDR